MMSLLKLATGLSPLYKIGAIIALLISLWGGVELWFYFHDKKVIEIHETEVKKEIDKKVKKHETEIKNTFEKPVSSKLNDFADGLLKHPASNPPELPSLGSDTEHADQRPEGNHHLGSTNGLDFKRTGTDPQQTESAETVNEYSGDMVITEVECDPEAIELVILNDSFPNDVPECIEGEWKILD